MLMWSQLNQTDQEHLRNIVNRLLAINYLVKEKERTTYLLIRRLRNELQEFFKFLGWDLVIDERHECVFLFTDKHELRKILTKDETIWFLILRLIYQEKRQSLSLASFPIVTTLEIKNKYETFRLPWINKTALEKYVRLCTRYQLLEAIDSNIRADDCRFSLFHTWQYVLDIDKAGALTKKITLLVAQDKEELLSEMAEENEVD
ncbi:hypothetical protein BHF68_06010 [Desulfuribacillus alkaliarsenatis]|uniref:Uncharacterized protein n=2 Tax=Desulfuribacillus alkaliarsenatis TaxID=766136 RepID=A0A1E5G2E7_9FIRM|nr:hypothetical protein BHF68_06010 [Desulfuribacillus alkaliarsenatis]